jgi:hypothetical protein
MITMPRSAVPPTSLFCCAFRLPCGVSRVDVRVRVRVRVRAGGVLMGMDLHNV